MNSLMHENVFLFSRKHNKSEIQTRLVILPMSYILKIFLEDSYHGIHNICVPQKVTKLGVIEEQLNLDVQPMELIFFKQNICVC